MKECGVTEESVAPAVRPSARKDEDTHKRRRRDDSEDEDVAMESASATFILFYCACVRGSL